MRIAYSVVADVVDVLKPLFMLMLIVEVVDSPHLDVSRYHTVLDGTLDLTTEFLFEFHFVFVHQIDTPVMQKRLKRCRM